MSTDDKNELKKYGKMAGVYAAIWFAVSFLIELSSLKTQEWSWLLYRETTMALTFGVLMAAHSRYQDKHQAKNSPSELRPKDS
jgi:hypothetical protein